MRELGWDAACVVDEPGSVNCLRTFPDVWSGAPVRGMQTPTAGRVWDVVSATWLLAYHMQPNCSVKRAWFWRMAAAVLILNLLDGIFTLLVVHSGVGEEANPLMAAPLAWGSVWFMAVKLALVSLGVLLLWRLRHRRVSQLAVVAMAGVYLFIVGTYHVDSMDLVAHSVAFSGGPG